MDEVRSLHGQDGGEDVVPHLARHAESEVEVLVMMRQMVLLHLTHVLG